MRVLRSLGMGVAIALAIRSLQHSLKAEPNVVLFSLTMSATIGLEHMVDVLDFGGSSDSTCSRTKDPVTE